MINRRCFHIVRFYDQYRFLFYGNKGHILLKSAEFGSYDACREAIDRCKECGADEENYSRMVTDAKEYYFVLKDAKKVELAYGKECRTQFERNANLMDCIKYIKNSIVIS